MKLLTLRQNTSPRSLSTSVRRIQLALLWVNNEPDQPFKAEIRLKYNFILRFIYTFKKIGSKTLHSECYRISTRPLMQFVLKLGENHKLIQD